MPYEASKVGLAWNQSQSRTNHLHHQALDLGVLEGAGHRINQAAQVVRTVLHSETVGAAFYCALSIFAVI